MSAVSDRGTRRTFHQLIGLAVGTAAVLALAATTPASAGEVREGVKARPGEMVLLRSVPTRVAYRPAPDGRALLIDPTPRKEISGALGADGELSDAEYAAIGGGPVHQAVGTLRAQTSALAGRSDTPDATRMPVRGVSEAVSPLGALGGAGRGIGDQVKAALGAMPLPTAPGQGGGG